MKKYTLTAAESFKHVPEHPERTAKRPAGPPSSMNFDMIYQVWPSREAMLTTIRMQGKRAPHWTDWTACNR